MSTYMLIAGGTGGHLFPAQALAQELVRRGHNVQLMTDARARTYAKDFPADKMHIIPSATPSLRNPIKAFQAGITILQGIAKSRAVLKKEKPVAVIGFGGYPTFPPFLAAKMLGIPGVLHEANSVLGRANRALARFSKVVALGFEKTRYSDTYATKCIFTGNPVRDVVHEVAKTPYPTIDDESPIYITVTGGSQGAQVFSDMLPGAVINLPDQLRARIRLVQQCRQDDLKRATAVYAETRLNVELAPFFPDLPRRISKSHLVICRSGASTVAEMSIIGRPGLYVPFPGSIDQDQKHNAQNMVDAGAGKILDQGTLSPNSLATELTIMLSDPETLKSMAANAKIVGLIDAVQRLAIAAENAALKDTK